MVKKVLISGITGQDGAFLAKYLLSQGHQVTGLIQKGRSVNHSNLIYLGIQEKVKLVEVDLCSSESCGVVIENIDPQEIYCLAGQSLVWASWNMIPITLQFNIESVSAMLEAIKNKNSAIKVFIALSSEVFGASPKLPVTETTPFSPTTPYAISKAAAYWLARAFRDRYGIFVANGFLFNHESILRPDNFVVKKIINTALRIASGSNEFLRLGNTQVRRDFGYAPEYVVFMSKALNAQAPDDYIVATGMTISIQEIVEQVFSTLDIPMSQLIIDRELYRPNEVIEMYGDPTRANHKIHWSAEYKGSRLISKLIEDLGDRFQEAEGDKSV